MNPNTEAILRERPFLERYFPKRKINKARVTRITEDDLNIRGSGKPGIPYDILTFGSNGKMLLFTKDGQLLGRVGKKYDWKWLLYTIFYFPLMMFWAPPDSQESIGQAILRVAGDTYYVAWLVNSYSSRSTNNEGDLIVFKPPPNEVTIRSWYEKEIAKQRENDE